MYGQLEAKILLAAPEAVGSPFRINHVVQGSQYSPDVGVSPNGDFVATWSGVGTGLGGSQADVFARRFSANGNPKGFDFFVNEFVLRREEYQKVTVLDGGGFVVVWGSRDTTGSLHEGVYAQRFSASGLPVGNEILVHATENSGNGVAIDSNPAGGFAVTWQNLDGLFTRAYDSNGNPLGSVQQVNSIDGSFPFIADVAMLDDGSYFVGWRDNYDKKYYLRKFSSTGTELGPEFSVVDDAKRFTDIATDGSSQIAIVWGGLFELQTQLFDTNGAVISDPIQVVQNDVHNIAPRVAMDPTGDFGVVWEINGDIFLQRFSSAGVKSYGIVEVSNTQDVHRNPTIEFGSQGNYLIAWERDATLTGIEIYGQRLMKASNSPPVSIEIGNNFVGDSMNAGADVGVFSTIDPDPSDSHTYSLVSGEGSTHNHLFQVVDGKLQTRIAFNFDFGLEYSVRIRSRDSGGLFVDQKVLIEVVEPEVFISNRGIVENAGANATIGNLTTSLSALPAPVSFSLINDFGDNSHFEVEGSTLIAKQSFNYESAHNYSVGINAHSEAGPVAAGFFTINVLDQMRERIPTLFNTGVQSVEPDGSIVFVAQGQVDPHFELVEAPAGVSLGSVYAPYEDRYPYTSNEWVNDAISKYISPFDGGQTAPFGDYTYQTQFDLTGFDSETVTVNFPSFAFDNIYMGFRVNDQPFVSTNILQPISEGFQPGLNTLQIRVRNNEFPTGFRLSFDPVATAVNLPPEITSDSAFSISENTNLVGVVTATDFEMSEIKFAIAGGSDSSFFELEESSGELRFRNPPDFELPLDSGGNPNDNIYELLVSATDAAGGSSTQPIQVIVNDVDEIAPTIESFSINPGKADRSFVNVIEVTFSEIVVADSSSFRVLNETTGETFESTVTTSNVNGQTIARLTFDGEQTLAGSLPDGSYILTVFGQIEDESGNQLDGDGDGQQGGDATEEFFRLFGDSNGDGIVNVLDLLAFRRAYNTPDSYDQAFDFNGDGFINVLDLLQFRKRFGTSI